MKRTIFFILLVAGLSLKAQQSSTNFAPSLSSLSKAPVAAPLHMNPELRQFAFQNQEGIAQRTGAAAEPQPSPLPDFRLEQPERNPMLSQSISCGGVIVDLRRIGEVGEAFGLMRPLDPNRDFKNILLDVQNERPRGIVLFSLNF